MVPRVAMALVPPCRSLLHNGGGNDKIHPQGSRRLCSAGPPLLPLYQDPQMRFVHRRRHQSRLLVQKVLRLRIEPLYQCTYYRS